MASKRKSGRDPLAGLSDRAKAYVEPQAEESPTYVESMVKRRKRRSDAIWPADATDKHKDSKTLSVRVPDELAEQVKAEASGAGQSVNAWLLELIQGYFER